METICVYFFLSSFFSLCSSDLQIEKKRTQNNPGQKLKPASRKLLPDTIWFKHWSLCAGVTRTANDISTAIESCPIVLMSTQGVVWALIKMCSRRGRHCGWWVKFFSWAHIACPEVLVCELTPLLPFQLPVNVSRRHMIPRESLKKTFKSCCC